MATGPSGKRSPSATTVRPVELMVVSSGLPHARFVTGVALVQMWAVDSSSTSSIRSRIISGVRFASEKPSLQPSAIRQNLAARHRKRLAVYRASFRDRGKADPATPAPSFIF